MNTFATLRPKKMDINTAVKNFKDLIDGSIIANGEKGKEAMIRSSKPIMQLHQAVKTSLIEHGIDAGNIFPPLGHTSPELRLAGFLKKKAQDITVTPTDLEMNKEVLKDGLLLNEIDIYGKDYTERTISINVRSQISSLAKNFDTLYERTIAEAINFHVRCPKMVLGEVYMIAVPEYNSEEIKTNKISFTNKVGTVAKYIKSFQAINSRISIDEDDYKYESACLLIVNFRPEVPVIYSNNEELLAAGLITEEASKEIDMSSLSWEKFTERLLATYKSRFI